LTGDRGGFSTRPDTLAGRAADLLRLVLLAGIPVMLVSGRSDAAVLMTLTGTTAVASRAAGPPAVAQLVFVGLLTIASYVIAFGGVGGAAADSAVEHFVLPAAVAPVLLGVVRQSGVIAVPGSLGGRRDVVIVAVVAGLTLALGTVWELVEYGSDAVFGTNMSPGYDDTIHDLIADTAGALTGAVLAVRFWPRER
jgi:hypothetical protein